MFHLSPAVLGDFKLKEKNKLSLEDFLSRALNPMDHNFITLYDTKDWLLTDLKNAGQENTNSYFGLLFRLINLFNRELTLEEQKALGQHLKDLIYFLVSMFYEEKVALQERRARLKCFINVFLRLCVDDGPNMTEFLKVVTEIEYHEMKLSDDCFVYDHTESSLEKKLLRRNVSTLCWTDPQEARYTFLSTILQKPHKATPAAFRSPTLHALVPMQAGETQSIFFDTWNQDARFQPVTVHSASVQPVTVHSAPVQPVPVHSAPVQPVPVHSVPVHQLQFQPAPDDAVWGLRHSNNSHSRSPSPAKAVSDSAAAAVASPFVAPETGEKLAFYLPPSASNADSVASPFLDPETGELLAGYLPNSSSPSSPSPSKEAVSASAAEPSGVLHFIDTEIMEKLTRLITTHQLPLVQVNTVFSRTANQYHYSIVANSVESALKVEEILYKLGVYPTESSQNVRKQHVKGCIVLSPKQASRFKEMSIQELSQPIVFCQHIGLALNKGSNIHLTPTVHRLIGNNEYSCKVCGGEFVGGSWNGITGIKPRQP